MNKQNLRKIEFQEEFVKMAVSCIGIKEKTAKAKATKLFRKYESLISWSLEDIEEEQSARRKTWEKYMTLKSGRIDYIRQIDNANGFILIKDIEQVETRQNEIDSQVVVTMKSGRKIRLSEAYDYLLEIF